MRQAQVGSGFNVPLIIVELVEIVCRKLLRLSPLEICQSIIGQGASNSRLGIQTDPDDVYTVWIILFRVNAQPPGWITRN
jgi:hypothetical protein